MTEILHRRTRLENTTLNRGCGGRSHNRIVQYARAGAGFLPSTVVQSSEYGEDLWALTCFSIPVGPFSQGQFGRVV